MKHRKWNAIDNLKTVQRGLVYASKLQRDVDAGVYDNAAHTLGIEQEGFVIGANTGAPIDIESTILNNQIGIRPETAICCAEYDLGKVTMIDAQGLEDLFSQLHESTQRIEKAIRAAHHPDAILVNSGVLPLVGPADWPALLLKDEDRSVRYNFLEEASIRENTQKELSIVNTATSETYTDLASNLSAHTRAFATQLHLGFPTFAETLAAYNVSVAVTGPMVALFANSPFIGEIESGLGSTRVELLAQGEQRRWRHATYAASLKDHYQRELQNPCPFIEENGTRALPLAYGAEHITTRLRLDEENKTSRIEIRGLDSLVPLRIPQAVAIHLGLVYGLPVDSLPSSEEVRHNFHEGRKGTKARFLWNGRTLSFGEMINLLLRHARRGLEERGFEVMAKKYLLALAEDAQSSRNDSDRFRDHVHDLEKSGYSRREAIMKALVSYHSASTENILYREARP